MGRLVLVLLLLLAGFAGQAAEDRLPILFVHGNGDSAALWLTTLWRFESNDYPPDLLRAFDFSHPQARDADSVPQANRSGTQDQLRELTAAIDRLLAETGRDRLILVGSSRGGYAIRNFIRHGGGGKVALAILCGTPNHGVFALPFKFDLEFNGMGPFLRHLNHPAETDPEVPFVTLRSDHDDKFAQPTGIALGFPFLPTFVDADGPALRGAENIVLPGLDHREVAFHPLAFARIYQAITGKKPARLEPVTEPAPVLGGLISGTENGAPTNLPLAGARLDLYQIDPQSGERLGEALLSQTTGADGRWGPFTARPDAFYEFVVGAAGYPITHIYRTPFPRSSSYVHLRLQPLPPGRKDGALVTLSRPRGYLGKGRDRMSIDGQPPNSVPDGVPRVDHAERRFSAEPRAVPVQFDRESLTVRTFPLAEGHWTIAEVDE
jgi:pimeloyl-ACP methyl ester carboxylesterase